MFLVRGAPITIRCECGRVERVPYGGTWVCEDCHRRWNTNQIPAEDYWGIMREMRKLRLAAIAAAVGITLVFGVLALAVSRSVLFLLPLVLGGWYIWYMPWWRRRVRRRARSMPTWELRPE
jgi:hypothetical protein